jgi:hypothetical protein
MTPQITATRVYKPPLAIDTHRAAEAAATKDTCHMGSKV